MDKEKKLRIGATAELTRVITSEDVIQMANISGDNNPIHITDEYASQTIFKKRIAHGLFCLGMVSNLLGTKLPGEGTILIGETINYKKPIFIGDSITTQVKIINIVYEYNQVDFVFTCKNQNDELTTDGTARVKLV